MPKALLNILIAILSPVILAALLIGGAIDAHRDRKRRVSRETAGPVR